MQLDPVYKVIGETIRSRRRHLRLTQEKLALQIGMSRASLANIETGRQTILVHQLCRFAEELEISAADLLPTLTVHPATNKVSDLTLPDDLNPQQRRQIARLLE